MAEGSKFESYWDKEFLLHLIIGAPPVSYPKVTELLSQG
jgi:hypothetical protein